MKLFLLFLISNFLRVSLCDLTKCLDFFVNNTSPGYNTLISNSGRHIFDLGLYDTCIQNENLTFMLLYIPLPIPIRTISQFTGICVPNFCDQSDFNDDIIPHVITPMLPVFKSAVAVDPKTVGSEFGAGSVAVIVILVLILSANLISPLFRVAAGFFKKRETVDSENNSLLEKESNNNNNHHQTEKKNSLIFEVLDAFALDLNLKKMFTLREGKLDFFNCLRALSLFYVIFGHEFLIRVNQSQNIGDLPNILKEGIFLLAAGGFYAVDVFYYLSGFFLAFVLIEGNLAYLKKPFTYVYAIVHRYFRIMPCYLIAILIYWKISVHLGDGPLFPLFSSQAEICREMWKNLIFIDDFYDQKCFGWGWYLSTDFQIFMYSLIMIYFYVLHRYLGFLMIWLSVAASFIFSFVLCDYDNYYLFPYVLDPSQGDYLNHYYYRPYTRAPPYLIGLFIGILYKEAIMETKKIEAEHQSQNIEDNRKRILNILKFYLQKKTYPKLIFYAVGLFWINFLIFFPNQLTQDQTAWSQGFQWVYLVFCRSFYILGIFCVTICCLLNIPDIVGFIANWKIWGYIARISFCAYLVHFFIIQRSYFNYRQSNYFSNESLVYWTISDIIITLVVATILSLLVEIPFMNLEKVVKGRLKKKGTKA